MEDSMSLLIVLEIQGNIVYQKYFMRHNRSLRKNSGLTVKYILFSLTVGILCKSRSTRLNCNDIIIKPCDLI